MPVPNPVPTCAHVNTSFTAYVIALVPAITFHCSCVVVPKLVILYSVPKSNPPAVILFGLAMIFEYS